MIVAKLNISSDLCIFLFSIMKSEKNQQQHRHLECARVSAPTTTSITITQEYDPHHIYERFDHTVSLTVDAKFDVNQVVK